MLLDSFFKIVETSREDDKTVVAIRLEKQHAIYDGHFPGNPVVPGVCLIQMIREVIEVLNGQKLMLTEADEIKFLNIVNPMMVDVLRIEIKNRPKNENPLAFSIVINDGQTTYLKMRAGFAGYCMENQASS
ncbi:MAG TPA: hydroxymyristoyl-ACP dehydratase [Bacteroidales bacterium]|jgi:3-hydroxyacyl-[acyl-carrier-protein] dehydratase|nr:hydroxymyristoyl-ACP dehydratase [Bacteroidales bacterium]HPB25958.1 hydroxymyristoyl-ACP dehydratase [Bacteroidales bacterium]HPI30840.1 hydroxymyristoyl-ACP dehydratase [Bacteroidales bacterium]HQN16478.1 hydroxymyristoyl-ACP dehydratase [Bacteroidales bacterium]HQP16358.1 hydroxymyristoyl-ACP dehydratase [Bacteroidales bacterium]